MTDKPLKDEAAINQSEIEHRFDNAPTGAFFTREELAAIRRCSIAKLDREAWLGTGIKFIRDGGRCLYRKSDVVAALNNGGAHE